MSSFVGTLGHLTSLSRPGEVLLIFESDDAMISWGIVDGKRVLLSLKIEVVNIVEDPLLIVGLFDARDRIGVSVIFSSCKDDCAFLELEKTIGVLRIRGLPHSQEIVRDGFLSCGLTSDNRGEQGEYEQCPARIHLHIPWLRAEEVATGVVKFGRTIAYICVPASLL